MIKEAMFYKALDDHKVHCYLCSHNCHIVCGKSGICGVRQNRKGVLYTLVYGKAIAVHIDPIEKKPLYHFFPGSKSYSLATMGCNFQCGFCQNWQISQVSKTNSNILGQEIIPEDIVKDAKNKGCKSISYTYTEPTIYFEYAYEICRLAKKDGLHNIFVTNGYMSKEAIRKISPFLDAANIDLKSFRHEFYSKNCKAKLKPVLESIKLMRELGIWIEVTTLVIPGENDSINELRSIAEFISGIDKNIPWHVSRFHPDYQFNQYSPTNIETLDNAYEQGKKAGLNYIYLGNVLQGNNTYCPNCTKLVIGRKYYEIDGLNLKFGHCANCQEEIKGVFV